MLRAEQVEQVYKPNSVSRFSIEMAIIHLVQLLPDGSSDLPGGRSPTSRDFGRAALLTPPYLILHCEEFAWPSVSPQAPVRSYFKPRRAAPFHPSPAATGVPGGTRGSPLAGLFSVALVVTRRGFVREARFLRPVPSR